MNIEQGISNVEVAHFKFIIRYSLFDILYICGSLT
jgi:hypothetical protein